MSPDILSHLAGAAKVSSAVTEPTFFRQLEATFITSIFEVNDGELKYSLTYRLQCQLCLSMEDRTMPLTCQAYCLLCLSMEDSTMPLTCQAYCLACLSMEDRTMPLPCQAYCQLCLSTV
jgi:hypothetical protein